MSSIVNCLSEIRQEIGGVRRDFRWTWRLMVAGFAALAGVMGRGFGWL